MLTLGIDASTSATGIVVIDETRVLHYSAETFRGAKTFWDKCDMLHQHLNELKMELTPIFAKTFPKKLDAFYIEEPMKRFAEGFSSAETLSILQRFNGIACYLTRDVFGIDPTYINVSSARKAAGVKVTTKAKAGGRNAKQQAFDHMMANDLKHIEWPKKQRSENIVDWAKDVTDAYIVARGGWNITKAV
jgi:hypothetical protein